MQTQAAKIFTVKGNTDVSFMISLPLMKVGAKRFLVLVNIIKFAAFSRFIASSSLALSFLISKE